MRSGMLGGGLLAIMLSFGSAALAQEMEAFAATAGAANMFEIDSSRLAMDISQNDAVRAFAAQMIADHTAAGEEMATAAEADGVMVPPAMTAEKTAQIETLRDMDPAGFDAAYVEAQVAAHDEAVALFQSFAAEAQPSALRDFATATLPTLLQHQAHIRTLADSEHAAQ